MNRVLLLLISLALLGGCGGRGGGGGGKHVDGTGPVTVIANSTLTGADITVATPVVSPRLNVEFLGVCDSDPCFAFSTGDTIHLGQTADVWAVGDGLSGSVQVSISGPNDISVSNIRTQNASDGTPGVIFTASVSGSAAQGGRTVLLRNTQGDITAFSGGLEVVP